MSLSVIILAAGKGSRMNVSENKVYIELNHNKIIDYSLRVFDSLDYVKEIICVYALGEESLIRDRVNKTIKKKNVKFVAGGEKRKDSVSNALKILSPSVSYFAVHDGARPFINNSLVDRLYEGAKEFNAVVPAVLVTDTIKKIDGDVVEETLDRNCLRAVQTPQVFSVKYKHLLIDNLDNKTDDASYVEDLFPVKVIHGSPFNLKITTQDDVLFAKALLRKVEVKNWLKQV